MYLWLMIGLTIHSRTDTNELQLHIPDALKGMELQIIILPVSQTEHQPIEFFTDAELLQLPTANLGISLYDDEDYTKW
ncbi:MAG: hypothetical protein QM610_16050 [Chitinophagaceae bacterium]